MAEFGPQVALAVEAAADLSAKQYGVMRLSGADLCNQASEAINSGVVGVLQNKPQSGEYATIAYSGKSKVVAGGALTVNDIITSNSSGKAAKVASGQMAFGRVLEAAGADGDVVTALLFPPIRWAGAA